MPKQLTPLPAQVTGEGNGFAKWHKSLSSITKGTPGFKLTLLHTDNGSHTSFELTLANVSTSSHHEFFTKLTIFIARGEDFVGQCEEILQQLLYWFSSSQLWNPESVLSDWSAQDSETRPCVHISVSRKIPSFPHLGLNTRPAISV